MSNPEELSTPFRTHVEDKGSQMIRRHSVLVDVAKHSIEMIDYIAQIDLMNKAVSDLSWSNPESVYRNAEIMLTFVILEM
jgi:hypothetical protein